MEAAVSSRRGPVWGPRIFRSGFGRAGLARPV